MTNYKLSRFFPFRFSKICFSAFLFFSLIDFAFADGVSADLAAYKEQVVSLATTFAGTANDLARSVHEINSACTMILQLTNDPNIIGEVQRIQPVANSISGRAASLRDTAIDISEVASRLTDSTSICDCSEQLSDISDQLDVIVNDWQWLMDELDKPYDAEGSTFFESIANLINENTAIWDIDFLQQDGRDSYYPLLMFQGLSSISNTLFTPVVSQDAKYLPNFVTHYRKNSTSGSGWVSLANNPFKNYTLLTKQSLLGLLQSWAGYNSLLLSSLNFCAETNEIAVSSIAKSSVGILGSITNLHDSISILSKAVTNVICNSITNIEHHFSIFNDFVFSGDSPLSMYSESDAEGGYHSFLTNYYIRIATGQQSASDPFTNWFSRVEILLASLVFQPDNGTINTNGVPSQDDEDEVRSIQSAFSDRLSDFVQYGNDHVSVIDTSGQSIVRMISTWNSAIGDVAKPSPFVVAEFSSPDSQSRSNISLYLDTDDEKLSSLIEIAHGISTLSWVSLFLFLGYNLAVYSIRALRKLISFSFSIYSAIFGGG